EGTGARGGVDGGAEDEGQEPRQEEDEDQVGEGREDLADVAEDDEPEGDRGEHEDRIEPAPLTVRQLEPDRVVAHRRLTAAIIAGPSSPEPRPSSKSRSA